MCGVVGAKTGFWDAQVERTSLAVKPGWGKLLQVYARINIGIATQSKIKYDINPAVHHLFNAFRGQYTFMERLTPFNDEHSRISAAETIAVSGSQIQALAKRHQLPFLDYLSELLVLEAWRVASREDLNAGVAFEPPGKSDRVSGSHLLD